ncbi:hypothetical protein [Pectinatus frisingensis]|uniref:hypothetical protein n=1 Tax=Pectinatus frisingensis TaxID=865 RepID=UPI001E35525F|nr:hypothetical protein [Pectinatus frisingensis]
MAWHRYKVKGKHYMTKRIRTLDIIARSDVIAKQKAIIKKLLPPFICEEIPFDPPSAILLEQASAAGLTIPDGASSDDVACLIQGKDDIAPPAGLTAFAERWDIYFSQYIGNRALYNTIFKNLLSENKAAFFVFTVYKFLSGDKKSNLDSHPYKDIFYKYATAAIADKRLMRSISNYKGEHLCTFGTAEGLPDGYKAGGVRTIAYKSATAFLKNHFDEKFLPLTTKVINESSLENPTVVSSGNKDTDKIAISDEIHSVSQAVSDQKPSVFIISKNDIFVPSKALELKNKIVKIPDLDKKAAADLPVYQPTPTTKKPLRELQYTNTSGKKSLGKTGCLSVMVFLIIILVVVFSFFL